MNRTILSDDLVHFKHLISTGDTSCLVAPLRLHRLHLAKLVPAPSGVFPGEARLAEYLASRTVNDQSGVQVVLAAAAGEAPESRILPPQYLLLPSPVLLFLLLVLV